MYFSGYGQTGGGGGRVPQRRCDPAEAGRREPRRNSGFASRLSKECHAGLGLRAVEDGKPAEAEAEYRTALAITQKLGRRKPRRHRIPHVPRWRISRLLAVVGLLAAMGKPAEAEAEYRSGLAIYQKLVED